MQKARFLLMCFACKCLASRVRWASEPLQSGLRRNRKASLSSPSMLSQNTASCLFLSPLWPENGSSAAGVRTQGLLRAFQDWGYNVSFAASARPNRYIRLLQESGVSVYECGFNREDLITQVLAETKPDVVVFDRFMAEEAFSFHIRKLAPAAVRILDMQDLHALRRGRQELAEAGAGPDDVLAHVPPADSDDLLRELGAIHRSDLTLVCSPVELNMLKTVYAVPPHKLVLASFFCDEAANEQGRQKREQTGALAGPGFAYGPGHEYEDRHGFVTIGGFKHAPNVDAVEWLASEVWPRIRAALPESERESAVMRVYGAHLCGAIEKLNAPEEGFFVCGLAKSLQVLAESRVLLAPLRYGAGIKGKIVDAWRYGLPVVTTAIGAEGMHATDAMLREGFELGKGGHDGGMDDIHWGGLIASSADEFAAKAVRLYCDRIAWERARSNGRSLLRVLYSREANLDVIRRALGEVCANLEERRARDYVGAVLWHHSARSTEYFSRWIELKNIAAGRAPPPNSPSSEAEQRNEMKKQKR